MKQLLVITTRQPPLSLTGNKQSFSTDRYMLNCCYLCSETNQIMDYSSLALTLGLSSICASVGQSHTCQRVTGYFPKRDKTWCNTGALLHTRDLTPAFNSKAEQNQRCKDFLSKGGAAAETWQHNSKQRKTSPQTYEVPLWLWKAVI